MCITCNENNSQPVNPCGDKISSDEVVYLGPNLECTGIETCDTLTVALQKLSDYLCSTELVQNIITTIFNNSEIREQFITIVNTNISCETVQTCITSTTVAPECTCFIVDLTIPPGTIALTDNGELTISWYDCDNVLQSQVEVTNGIKSLGCVNLLMDIQLTGLIDGEPNNFFFTTVINSNCCL